MTKTILAFGGGVDSTAILAAHLYTATVANLTGTSANEIRDAIGQIDHVVFADPGAEFAHTYTNVDTAIRQCGIASIPFSRVRKMDKDGNPMTIQQWLLGNGTVPVMPGGPHVCSLKFKGEPMQKWATKEYAGDDITWLVGIEANETQRARFQADPKSKHQFKHPLVDLGWTRETCEQIIAAVWPHAVKKSSCVFCPFMSQCEIEQAAQDDDAWAQVEEIERAFEATSAIKHQAWLDAGKPLVGEKRPRAPKGMWRIDSWAAGARLFAKRVEGRQLSTGEWRARVTVVEDAFTIPSFLRRA
jgi:hypothetical protein